MFGGKSKLREFTGNGSDLSDLEREFHGGQTYFWKQCLWGSAQLCCSERAKRCWFSYSFASACLCMSAVKLLQSTVGPFIYGFYSHRDYHLWEQMLWKRKLLLYGTWTKWFSSIIISQIILVSQVFPQHLWGIKYCMEWGDSKNKDRHAQGMCTYSIILQTGRECLWNLASAVGHGINPFR